jgi:hypothetical protein
MRRFFAARSELPAMKEPLRGSCPGLAPTTVPFNFDLDERQLPVIRWHYRPTESKNAKIKISAPELGNAGAAKCQKRMPDVARSVIALFLLFLADRQAQDMQSLKGAVDGSTRPLQPAPDVDDT